MKHILTALPLLCALTGAALADQMPIDGTFADADGCAHLAGGTESQVFLVLRPDRVETYGSVCEIAETEYEDGALAVIHAACREGDDNWVDSYTIEPTEDGEGWIVTSFYVPDMPRELRVCE